MKTSIMIIDDDKFLLDMYIKKFKQSGVEAEAVIGSEEALNKLRTGAKPDILILDIIMPSMDGMEFLETIRKEKLVPDAKVIMLTNESNRNKIEQAKKLGAQGYIVKATSIPSEVVEETFKIAGIKIAN